VQTLMLILRANLMHLKHWRVSHLVCLAELQISCKSDEAGAAIGAIDCHHRMEAAVERDCRTINVFDTKKIRQEGISTQSKMQYDSTCPNALTNSGFSKGRLYQYPTATTTTTWVFKRSNSHHICRTKSPFLHHSDYLQKSLIRHAALQPP
jgi:hypothetical protein